MEDKKETLEKDAKTTTAAVFTSLGVGDIAFSSINTDGNDEFSFVLLTDISGTTTIHFTDDGFNSGSGSLLGGEGTVTWTYTGSLPAGTEVSILLPRDSNFTGTSTVGGMETGTTTETGAFSMSSSGDSLIAYTGTVGVPTTYIAAVYIGGLGFTEAATTTTSAIPTGLSIAAFTAMQNGGTSDNYQFDCNQGNITTVSDLRESLFTIGNFVTTTATINYPAPGCNYLAGGCSAPTAQATSASFGAETSSTLTLNSFTAPAGGATGYTVYINSTNSFSAPNDGDEPVANLNWNNAGQQPIYFGISNSPTVTITGLDPGTQYFFQVYAYNDCTGIETYETTGLNANDTTALGVLTITGITGDDKVYDDTTAASATGTASLAGVEVGDDVSLGGSPVFTFASANVGTGITITTTGYTISGTDAGKYTLTQPTLSADITAKELTMLGITVSNKVYDGTTSGTTGGTDTLTGVIPGDIVSIGGAPVSTFASANVGTGITVNTTGFVISGTDAGNYTLTQPTTSADITAKALTITGITGDNKVDDGTTAATATGTASLSGVEVGDDVTLGGSPVFTFASANVGTGITITTTGYTINGTDSGNYTLTQPTLSADITAAPVIITSIVRSDPTDATTSADQVIFRVTFAKPVINVDVSDFALSGTSAGDGIISLVTPISTSIYDVTVTEVTSSNGTLNLDIKGNGGVSGSNNIEEFTGSVLSQTATGNTIAQTEIGQSFTASSDGNLIDVTFYMNVAATYSGAGTLELRLGDGLTGTVLATEAVTFVDQFTAYKQKFTFSTPATVTSGSVYTIRITGAFGSSLTFDALAGDPFAGGIIYIPSALASADLTFEATISSGGGGVLSTTAPVTDETYTISNILPLTITGLTGDNKIYDGTTVASASGTAALSGVSGGDDVTLIGTPVYAFASSNVGTGITITTTGYTLGGVDAGNYTLTQPTLSADITQAPLTVTGITGDDKIYDGTTAATASGTAALSGIIGADDVTLGGSPVFIFASPNGGTGITINTTGYSISGTDSGNYTLTQPTLSADITGQTVAITSTEIGPTGANPIPVTITFSGSVTGFVEGEITVGNGTTSNFSGSGAVYTVDIIPTAAGNVTIDVNANVAVDGGMTGNEAAPQFSITYDNLLGVDDELLATGVRLYPIPATNSITIHTDTSLRIEKAEIFDIRGKMIISKVLNSTSEVNTIDISSMESGVYLMTVYSENGSLTQRIIKQ